MKNFKIKKFIQIGSSAEYGDNKSPLKENFSCFPKRHIQSLNGLVLPIKIFKFLLTIFQLQF